MGRRRNRRKKQRAAGTVTHGTVTQPGSSTQQRHNLPLTDIRVFDPDNGKTVVQKPCTMAFLKSAREAGWPVEKDEDSSYLSGLLVVHVPSTHVSLYEGRPVFSSCVLDAGKKYAEHIFGRKLDRHDEEWARAHPLSDKSGVTAYNIPSFLQDLLKPYGLGVSAVYLPRGKPVLEKELAQWQAVLGTNPLALQDLRTSNEEAAVSMGLPPDSFDNCRFVYSDNPPRPCVLAGKAQAATKVGFGRGQTVVSGTFSHSEYCGPRAKNDEGLESWGIAVQLDLLERVQYMTEPVLPEYVPRRGSLSVAMSSVKGPDGKYLPLAANQGVGVQHKPSEIKASPVIYSGGRPADSGEPYEKAAGYDPQLDAWGRFLLF